jgi:hypothetical protein
MVIFRPDQKRFQQSAHKQETRAQIGAIGLLSMPTAWLIRRGHRHRRSSKKEIGGAGGRDSERGSGGPASRAREGSRMVIFRREGSRMVILRRPSA